MKMKGKNVSPLLILVLLTIGIGAVGSILYTIYINTGITTTYDVYGADVIVGQVGLFALYETPVEASSWETQLMGTGGAIEFRENTIFFCVMAHNLVSGEDLLITVTDGNGNAGISAQIIQYGMTGTAGDIEEGPVVTPEAPGVFRITYAQLEDVMWEDTLLQLGTSDYNALLISLDYPGVYADTTNGLAWETGVIASYDVSVDIDDGV